MDSSNDTGKQSFRERATHFCSENPKWKATDSAIAGMARPSLTAFGTQSPEACMGTQHLGGWALTQPQEGKGEPFFPFCFFFYSFPFFFLFPLPVIVEPLRREFMCVIICVVIGSLAYESLTKLTEVSFGEKCNQLLHSDTLHQINSCCLYGFGLSCLMVSFPKIQGRRPRAEKGQKPQGWRFLSQIAPGK